MASKTYKPPSLITNTVLSGEQGKYRILKKVNRGAQGIVYRAQNIETKEIVAVKLFSPREPLARRKWQTERTRFKNEFKKLRTVVHWNILHAIDRGITRFAGLDIPFMVIEYLPSTLEGALPTSAGLLRRLSYCAQLSDAVGYLNTRGHTIHRDIKPANILVDTDLVLKLSDLGIALVDRRHRPPDLYNETTDPRQHPRFYLSPEQLVLAKDPKAYPTAERRYAALKESDIFQLGKVCHEILVGTNPIGQVNWNSPTYASAPRYLRSVLKALLSQDPDSRLSLEASSEVFHTSFGVYLYLCLKKAEGLTKRLRECLSVNFRTCDARTVKGKWVPFEGFSKIVNLGLLRRIERDTTDTYELTALGCDVRDIVLQNNSWIALVKLHSDLHRMPHPLYVGRPDHAMRKAWSKWKRNPYGRHIREFAKVHEPDNIRLYLLPPRKIGNRWYVEALSQILGPRTMPLSWRGYDPPVLVVDGPSKTSTLERLQKRWPRLALSGLDGFSFQSCFYISRTYLQMRPDAVFSGLTREGPTTVTFIIEPCLEKSGLRDVDVGLDWVLLERCEFSGFQNDATRRVLRDIYLKVRWLLKKRSKHLGAQDAQREILESAGIGAEIKDMLSDSIIIVANPELRALNSILMFFFKSFGLTIRRASADWEFRVHPQQLAFRLGYEVAHALRYRPKPVTTEFAAEYPVV